ncbi:universal stress protein [Pandoraea sputorum]|uniref:universal stress protein n=1 Tax=Pandoraea sputorum TaxID=93222 RepID=UPI0012402951|nr:UspA domain-containing protein [Pandoraea sputorum]
MFKRLLVAIEGSPTSDRALDYALAVAKARAARLRVLFVVDVPLACGRHRSVTLYRGITRTG